MKHLFYFIGACIPPYFKNYARFCPYKGRVNCPMWNCYYHFFNGRYSHFCNFYDAKLNNLNLFKR